MDQTNTFQAIQPKSDEREPLFTEEDQKTWREFYRRHEMAVAEHGSIIHEYYLEYVSILKLFKNHIPSRRELMQVLEPFGWSVQYVHGYHPPWKVFRLLHAKIMPLSASIRPAHEVGFAREPDIIHDIFGHLPALLHPDYRRILGHWSALANQQPLSAIDRTLYHLNKTIVQNKAAQAEIEALKRVARDLAQLEHVRLSPMQIADKLYFWIFEFGVLENPSGPKILGAGLISSLDELASIHERCRHQSVQDLRKEGLFQTLTWETICRPYSISDSQTSYGTVADIADYDQLIDDTRNLFKAAKRDQKASLEKTALSAPTGDHLYVS